MMINKEELAEQAFLLIIIINLIILIVVLIVYFCPFKSSLPEPTNLTVQIEEKVNENISSRSF